MNIGSIGKALVNEAIDTTKKNVIDAVTGTPKPAPAVASAPPSVETPPASLAAMIVGQIQAMQRPLKEDQELAVTVRAGGDGLRVTEIFVPGSDDLVFAGTDERGNITRLITPAAAAQVVCKVLRVSPGAAPSRVNVITPRPQPKPAA
jgi:hypothetical protein